MNFKLSNLLLFFLPVLGFSQQEINIEIHQDLFHQAEKSLLILSDSLGEILSYKIITDANSINQKYDLMVENKNNGSKHFTIINEYLKKKDAKTIKYFNAVTYVNIPDLFHIESEEMLESSFTSEFEMKSTVIFIKGVDILNDIEIFERPYFGQRHPRRSYRYQKRRKTLKINWTGYIKEDLYIYMRCNDESEYRFLYIPKSEVNDKMSLDFNDLPKGLDTISIDIENKGKTKWRSSLNFKNDGSNYRTYLTYLLDEDFDYPLKYLIPADDSFYDFELTLAPIMEEGYFSYIYKNEGISPLIKLNPLEIAQDVDIDFEEQSVEMTNYNESFKFEEFILSKTMIGGRSGTSGISNWQVKGRFEDDYLSFQYPNIDEYFKDELKSLEMVNNILQQYYQLKTGEKNGKTTSLTGVKK